MSKLYFIRMKDIWQSVSAQDTLFWLANIYLFLEYVRPQTLYPSIAVIPFARITIALGMLFLLLGNLNRFVKNPVNKLMIMMLLVILISSANALSPGIAFSKVSDFISWIFIYFIIVNAINTEDRFLIFMLAFLLYSFKMSQFSFLNWVATGFSFRREGTGGGPGWFNNSGEFGIQMCIFLPLASCFYYALHQYWSRLKKGFFLLFPLTALTGAISCSSRGALVGVVSILLFMLFKTKNKLKVLFIVITTICLVYVLLPDKQKERLVASGQDNTSVSRLQLWGVGLDMVRRHPVLGVGYRNWGVAQTEVYGVQNQLLPHNVFIECAAELGLSGFLCFVLLIGYTFYNNYQSRKLLGSSADGRFLSLMADGLDAALVGYLVSGFFVTVLYYPYFWINLSMTVALRNVAVSRVETVPVVAHDAGVSLQQAGAR
ncbi:O-antigen ligase family protein [Geomonas anaerohicana]|uniref:O-antigen ligase family protein n=1 Tax=Geomonas anaerohicana TaxID=2798583 RepID=A0ABS0YD35_9BACT|nr:O-antigen ligase family protein [Geomonas anaerohicana]MBJ6749824.1 O-antigen ligase family protein [Geomonas anaerohicana]